MGKQEQDILRGKKWKIAKAKAVFLVELGKGKQEDVDWFDTQESIVNDIQEYEDSIKDSIKPEEPTKAKPKKADKEA